MLPLLAPSMLALRAPPPKMYEPWLKNYRVGYGTTQGTYGYVRYFKPEEQPGVQAPLGFWDPLGLSKPNEQGDVDEELFFRRRVAEIKHGRFAMLACVGYIVPYFQVPRQPHSRRLGPLHRRPAR